MRSLMLRFLYPPDSRTPVTTLKNVVASLVTMVIYLCAAAFEEYASHPLENRGTVWWAAGWSVAMVFLYGRWCLPGVFLGEVLSNLLFFNKVWWTGVVTGFGNSVEALIGATLLIHYGFSGRLNTVRDVRQLYLVAIILPLPMLIFQTPAFWIGQNLEVSVLPFRMLVWYTNDALAVIYVVPLACLLIRPKEMLVDWRIRWRELCLLISGMVFITMLAFQYSSAYWFAEITAFSLLFFAWSGIRFDPGTTVILLVIHAFILIICIARRLDPFTHLQDMFPFLHLPMIMACMLAEFLAASVAERKSAERRFLQSARWEGLGAFAGGLAHEMNNQLTVILGSTQLVDSMVPKDSSERELLASVTESAEKMAKLVGNLLAYAGRGVALDARPTDVVAVVREAVAGVNGNVQLDLSAAPHYYLLVDATLLRLAIRNLIINGLEALPESGGRVKVSVHSAEMFAEDLQDAWPLEGTPGSYLIVKVADNGCGMSKEVSQRMFDPFFSTKFTGRGLGLAVVAGVIRQMEGCIRVQTAEGVGTTIQMYLPARIVGSQF